MNGAPNTYSISKPLRALIQFSQSDYLMHCMHAQHQDIVKGLISLDNSQYNQDLGSAGIIHRYNMAVFGIAYWNGLIMIMSQ